MEELETLERFECPECPGPPPEFRLPPPPRPPFLTEGTFCPETIPDLEDCGAFPMIDPSYHTNPSLQSTALIITCAVVLLLMAAIVSVVFWKHKRKVQNLLPCKSAAGTAATAGRVRVLPDGQPIAGTVSAGSAVLYEDLPEAGGLPQLHNHHLPSHHHQTTGQPTIEVRGTNHSAWQQRSKMERVPAPHHLDYLDYRDPRAILRVAEKPSRAVLGGYRTPRALLAKSQGVPLSIATHVTTNNRNDRVSSLPRLFVNEYNTRSAIRDSPIPTLHSSPSEEPDRSINESRLEDRNRTFEDRTSSINDLANYNENDSTIGNTGRSMKLSRNRDNDYPITPTHRPRIGTPSPSSSIVDRTNRAQIANSSIRRPSVDSEGYSYIDFDDRPADNVNSPIVDDIGSKIHDYDYRLANYTTNPRLSYSNVRNDSMDSDGYSYIDPYYRRAPGSARRIANDGYTDEEVCPLCTMQQIQNLLARPEDAYVGKRDT